VTNVLPIKRRSSKSLSEFWRLLKRAKIVEDGKCLVLANNITFLGRKKEGSSLYICKCYRDMKIMSFDEKIDKLHINGNPGIGKTFFGYYLIYLLALKR
jgi:hypothetical protein